MGNYSFRKDREGWGCVCGACKLKQAAALACGKVFAGWQPLDAMGAKIISPGAGDASPLVPLICGDPCLMSWLVCCCRSSLATPGKAVSNLTEASYSLRRNLAQWFNHPPLAPFCPLTRCVAKARICLFLNFSPSGSNAAIFARVPFTRAME